MERTTETVKILLRECRYNPWGLGRVRGVLFKWLNNKSKYSPFVEMFLVLCIAVNIVCFLLQQEVVFQAYWKSFQIAQTVTTAVFVVEWVLRLWSITLLDKYAWLGPIKGRLWWMVSFSSILDLLAFVPFFAFYGDPINKDDQVTSSLRGLRILAILKAGRHCKAYGVLGKVIWANRDMLLASLMLSFAAFIFVSTMLFYAMRGYLVGEYDTIPECMFASVLMLTGLGGFEQTPYNTWAKLLASVTAVVALCVFAVPAGIIASNYEEFFENQLEEAKKEAKRAKRKAKAKGETPGRPDADETALISAQYETYSSDDDSSDDDSKDSEDSSSDDDSDKSESNDSEEGEEDADSEDEGEEINLNEDDKQLKDEDKDFLKGIVFAVPNQKSCTCPCCGKQIDL
eukprot:TRINITY_DN4485_c0_g1_i1.p1 TRINITY_DN4485_c0_g1~~TRINITY_DN4485_c0_g1_i1.p1  ORF type:complete len:411 (+),score=97.14 TRINITY_DN4485_c0_g1_i1:34-1233(+)